MMTISNQRRNEFNSSHVTPDGTNTLTEIYAQNPSYQNVDSPNAGSRDLNDKLHVYVGDVTDLAVDAIVSSTQTDLSLEPIGICMRVWSQGGAGLRNECIAIGHCDVGEAFLTQGHELSAKYVIHTAGPPPDTSLSYAERKQCLRQSYISCLEKVRDTQGIRSVSFPCLGTGGAGIQLSAAINIAVTTLREWLTTGNNSSMVDHIVLCMYDDYQWTHYCPLLIKTFPFPKAVSLEPQTVATMGKHEDDSQPMSTNILCYKYNRNVIETITSHFDQLVDMLKQTLSCPRAQVSRNKDVVSLELNKLGHQLRMCHIKERGTLEFLIVNTTECEDSVDIVTCSEVQAVIENVLVANFENVTNFNVHIRCEHSYMGERSGLWRLDILQNHCDNGNTLLKCCHPRQKLNHSVDINQMLKYWRFSKLVTSDGSVIHNNVSSQSSREPVEVSLSDISCPTPSIANDLGAAKMNLPMRVSQGREIEQNSWESSRECSSLSESKSESETGFEISGKQCTDNSNSGTSNLPSFLRKGVQKLRKFVSSSSSETETEISNSIQQIKDTRRNGFAESYDKESNCRQSRESDEGYSDTSNTQADCSSVLSLRNPSTNLRTFQVINVSSGPVKSQCITGNLPHSDTASETVKSGVENDEGGDSSTEWQESNTPGRKPDMSDKTLLSIARHIGNKHKELGIELGLRECEVQACHQKGEGNANMYGMYILKKWRVKEGRGASVDGLFNAMENCDIDTYYLKETYCR